VSGEKFGGKGLKMRKILFASGVLIVFCVGLFIEDAGAIPVFARKYKTTCATCHAPFPKLSAMGEAFRLNGYKLPGGADEIYVKQEPLSLGAEAYKQIFPNSIWPSSLPGIPPISFNIIGDVLVDPTGTHKNSTEFDFQNIIDIHAAGNFGDHLAFFTEVEFTPVSPSTSDTTAVSSSAAWLMYQSILPDYLGANHFNIKAGNIGKLEISLPNIRFDNSYQVNDYLYASELNLGSEPGFEINGFGSFWKYALGIVKSDFNNSDRDFYGQLNFKIGGLGFDGSGGQTEEGGLKTAPAGYWRDDSIMFGFFAYRTYDTNTFDSANYTTNAFDRFGGDIRWSCGDFAVGVGFMRGLRNDFIIPQIFGASFTELGPPPPPFAALSAAAQALFPTLLINENIWTVDAQYFVYPWLVPYARYELVDVTNVDGLDKQRLVAGVTMLVVGNVRVNVEGRYYFQNQPLNLPGVDPSTIDSSQVAARLHWAF
jgi:hypothetical protein